MNEAHRTAANIAKLPELPKLPKSGAWRHLKGQWSTHKEKHRFSARLGSPDRAGRSAHRLKDQEPERAQCGYSKTGPGRCRLVAVPGQRW
jgi:hypothetical protein